MEEAKEDSGLRVPVRDRVLLHLTEFQQFRESVEVPFGMSQSGIAFALGVDRSQVTKALKELKRRDLVEERLTYVAGAPRRCRVYSLAMPGEVYVGELKKLLLSHWTQFQDGDGQPASAELSEVQEALEEDPGFSQLVVAALAGRVRLLEWSEGKLTRAAIVGPPAANVVPKTPVAGDERTGEKEEPALSPDEEADKDVGVERAPSTPVEEATYGFVMGSPFYDVGSAEAAPPAAPVRQPWGSALSPERLYEPARHIMTGYYEQALAPQYWTAVPPAVPPVDPARPEQSINPAHRGKMGLLAGGFSIIYFCLIVGGLSFDRSFYFIYPCCCSSGFLLLLGLGVVFVWSVGHGSDALLRLLGGARLAVIGQTAAAFALLVWMLSQALGPRLDEMSLLALFIVFPALYAFVAVLELPVHMRAELGVSVGAFLMLSSAVALFDPLYFGLNSWMLGIIIVLGAGLFLIGREIGGLWGAEALRGASPGIGASLIVLPAATIYLGGAFGLFTNLALGSLALFGAFLLVLPLLGARRAPGIYRALGRSMLICAGTALLVLGISLVARRVFVGAVEILFAIPVIYYGAIQFQQSFMEERRTAIAVAALALAVEVVSLARLLWLF